MWATVVIYCFHQSNLRQCVCGLDSGLDTLNRNYLERSVPIDSAGSLVAYLERHGFPEDVELFEPAKRTSRLLKGVGVWLSADW